MSIRPLHLHSVFRTDLSVIPLRRSLQEMEKRGSKVDEPLRVKINAHLDKIYAAYRGGSVDKKTANAWVGRIDSFIQNDFEFNSEELSRIDAVDRFISSGVFDSRRFLILLSPFTLRIAREDQAFTDRHIQDKDFQKPDIKLPKNLVKTEADRAVQKNYESGSALLDQMIANVSNLNGVTVEDIARAKLSLYCEAILLLKDPKKYRPQSSRIADMAVKTEGRDAAFYVISHMRYHLANEIAKSGQSIPLMETSPDIAARLSNLGERLESAIREFVNIWPNSISEARKGLGQELFDWNAIESKVVSAIFSEGTKFSATLQKFVDVGLQLQETEETVESFSSFNSVLQTQLDKVPLEENFDRIVSSGRREAAMRFRLDVELDFQEQNTRIQTGDYKRKQRLWQISDFLYYRHRKWKEHAEKVFKQKDWTGDFQQYVYQEAQKYGRDGVGLMAQLVVSPEYQYKDLRRTNTREGFKLQIGDDHFEITVGPKFQAGRKGKIFQFTIPSHDTVSDASRVRGWLNSAPFWAGLPKYVRDKVLENIAEYFRNDSERFDGVGTLGRVRIGIDPKGTAQRLEAAINREIDGIKESNYQQKFKFIRELLKAGEVEDFTRVIALERLFQGPQIESLIRYCRSSLDKANGVTSDEYRNYVLFLADWVNVTRAAPPDMLRAPVASFLEKFPPPDLTAQNARHAGEILGILKAIPGELYGKYIDGIALNFERRYLSSPTVQGIAAATQTLQELFRHCGNQYRASNFRAFWRGMSSEPDASTIPLFPTLDRYGLVRISSKDGRNLYDDLFETLYQSVKAPLHEIMMFPEARKAFIDRTPASEKARAELLFNHYGKTLTLKLKDDRGIRDDLRDIGNLASSTDFTSPESIAKFAAVMVERGTNKLENYVGEKFGPNEAWRREMFEGKVAPPLPAGTIRGGIQKMEILFRDGAKLGYMYVVDMKSDRFKVEMLGVNGEGKQWSNERVTDLRPRMAIETVGVYADNLSRGPAWAMGVTDEKGKRVVLNDFWSRQVDGVVVISDDFHDFKIVHREELVGSFDKRKKFEDDFRKGRINNYAQAQLLIYNGGNVYNGQPVITPTNTYQDWKRIIAVDTQGRLVVIKLTEDVTFYEAHSILKQIGISTAVNMDKCGSVQDHSVDEAGVHHYDGLDGSMNYVSKFVVSVE